ncbi:MAG: hypothetical protein NWF00_05425 [Candidatus Bathyarchaeota archaeon]|nr:hypothetical protein [Candidatus Bathyarchaeota archaeon]
MPAGTFKVFRIDLSVDDITYNLGVPLGSFNLNLDMILDLTGHTYVEYGTMR